MTTTERVIPVLVYQDIQAAHDFLVHAFGFEAGGVERGPDGQPVHLTGRSHMVNATTPLVSQMVSSSQEFVEAGH